MNKKTKRLLKAMAQTPYSKSFKVLQVKKKPAEAKKRSYDKAAKREAIKICKMKEDKTSE